MKNDNTFQHFLSAQQNIYPQVIKELQSGRKISHWMWFIFPQIDGLGHSPTAKYYSIKSMEEAKQYIEHLVLGVRLIECCNILLQFNGRSSDEIFGYPDNLKLRSCMTLFNFVAPEQKVFADVLKKYFNGKEDDQTREILVRRY